ncbi:MAG: VWA domain-containing protein, partial [Devosiaceae bacterium]|nr:VWA domain-containing protein [Devosiaceae bacterium]
MSDPMNDDLLKSLKDVETPRPDQFARAKALGLGMEEFDAVRAEKTIKNKKSSNATQGNGRAERPMSIINWIKGFIPMQARFPVVATLSGLLLLPLGVLLYQNTAITPIDFSLKPPVIAENSAETEIDLITKPDEIAPVIRTRAEPVLGEQVAGESIAGYSTQADPSPESGIAPLPSPVLEQQTMVVAYSEAGGARQQGELLRVQGGKIAASAPQNVPVGGIVAPTPTDGFLSLAPQSNDNFAQFEESPVKSVASAPVSTFSIDVDTASYAYVRRTLNEGRMPVPEAVRIEELINYFTYDYAAPRSVETPFAPQIEIAPSPWNEATQLMRIGIEGYVPPADERQPVNLVFLIDTSGSMNAPDKLPLLKQAFALVVDQLDENDRVSIVTYAGSAGMVLAPTAASNKAAILSALQNLQPGGSTAGAAGIELAYRLAEQSGVEGSVNRVLLATDGDFNVGISSEAELKRFIENKRQGGTFLSILGFGMGNLNDALMQTLAQNGNGSAYYIDSFREAHKVLVEEIGSTLTTIAKDVKIQIEFNPALIAEYRLIGYETRILNRQDFNNDKVDAGDIGAGHTVTALYELTPVGAQSALIDPLRYGETVTLEGGEVAVADTNPNEIGFFKLRYKAPDGDVSKLIELPITQDMVRGALSAASDDTRFAIAVAAFGQKLRGSN